MRNRPIACAESVRTVRRGLRVDRPRDLIPGDWNVAQRLVRWGEGQPINAIVHTGEVARFRLGAAASSHVGKCRGRTAQAGGANVGKQTRARVLSGARASAATARCVKLSAEMGAIYLRHEGTYVATTERPYESEHVLQEVLEQASGDAR